MAEEENKNVIVSRIQHRRGLKQDLPQPLRPGEIGLATDSRQVYVGGDPDDPQSGQYNAVSYIENTVGARDHILSIVDNQLIAFQVPFIKYMPGEWNGISTSKSWNPADARSIMSAQARPACRYASSTYPVFSPLDIVDVMATVVEDIDGDTVLYIRDDDLTATNLEQPERVVIGDLVTGDGITGTVYVSDIEPTVSGPYAGSDTYTVTLTSGQSLSAGDKLTFKHHTGLNFKTYQEISRATATAYESKFYQGSFKSSDVTVHKNGIRLVPEANANNVGVPSPTADYTLNALNVDADGTHTITMRTTPQPRDDISICYYNADDVRQMLKGIPRTEFGQEIFYLSNRSNIKSFYEDAQIPWYRHINPEMVSVSTTTGLGYIGLEQKHIVCVADGERLTAVAGLNFGKFRISREDQIITPTSTTTDGSTITLVFKNTSETNLFSDPAYLATLDSGLQRYVYDQIRLYSIASDLHDITGVYDVVSVSTNGTDITLVVSGTYTDSSAGIRINPILSIDLSDKTTIQEAIAQVSKPLVPIAAVSEDYPIQIFPMLDWLPQEDQTNSVLYVTSKPAYTSLSSGGIEFRLYEDTANTLDTMGLTEGVYNRHNNTVRAKLERWMNNAMHSRDLNVFVGLYVGGTPYYDFNLEPTIPNYFGQYELTLNDSYNEVLFCDRQEAANFNRIANNLYGDSRFDRSSDDADGTRGLINLKNNLEILTREASGQGEKIVTYNSVIVTTSLLSDTGQSEVIGLPVDIYNAQLVDYTITEVPGQPNKYMRTGTIYVASRGDFVVPDVAINDNFSSVFEVYNLDDADVVEPRFTSRIENNRVILSFRDDGNGNLEHNIGSNLRIKYVIRRWSAID